MNNQKDYNFLQVEFINQLIEMHIIDSAIDYVNKYAEKFRSLYENGQATLENLIS